MGFRDLAVSNPIGGIYSCVGTKKKRAMHVHTAGGYVKSSAVQVSGISWEYA